MSEPVSVPSSAIVMSITTASRSSPSPSDVRSVESFSGSIGKIAGGGVDRGRVGPRVAVDGGVLLHQRIDVGDGDEDPAPSPAAAGCATVELIEVARIVVVDRNPMQVAQVSNIDAGCRGRSADPVALRDHSRREVRQEPAFPHRLVRDALEVALVETVSRRHRRRGFRLPLCAAVRRCGESAAPPLDAAATRRRSALLRRSASCGPAEPRRAPPGRST